MAVGGAPAEFPFGRLMSKCAAVALAHSAHDAQLTSLWPAAEHARAGRDPVPPALGLDGLVEEELEENLQEDEAWMERVQLLECTSEMAATASAHGPIEYLLCQSVRLALRGLLFA